MPGAVEDMFNSIEQAVAKIGVDESLPENESQEVAASTEIVKKEPVAQEIHLFSPKKQQNPMPEVINVDESNPETITIESQPSV